MELEQEVLTLPEYQLSSFSEDVKLLELVPSQHIDTYDPIKQKWITQSIDKVQSVEPNQQVLYHICCGLTDVVSDCPGLEDELHKQGQLKSNGKWKAKLDEHTSPIRLQEAMLSEGTIKWPQMLSPEHGSLGLSIKIRDSPPNKALNALTQIKLNVVTWPQPFSPALKSINPLLLPDEDCEWPSDWTVYEIVTKLAEIKAAKGPGIYIKDLFPQVFKRCYVRQTVNHVEHTLEKAGKKLVECFKNYGHMQDGLWPHFLQVKNRSSQSDVTEDEGLTQRDGGLTDDDEKLYNTIDLIGSKSYTMSEANEPVKPAIPVCPYCE